MEVPYGYLEFLRTGVLPTGKTQKQLRPAIGTTSSHDISTKNGLKSAIKDIWKLLLVQTEKKKCQLNILWESEVDEGLSPRLINIYILVLSY